MACVHRAVRNESLNAIYLNLVLERVKNEYNTGGRNCGKGLAMQCSTFKKSQTKL
jgi:hypothetical protein